MKLARRMGHGLRKNTGAGPVSLFFYFLLHCEMESFGTFTPIPKGIVLDLNGI